MARTSLRESLRVGGEEKTRGERGSGSERESGGRREGLARARAIIKAVEWDGAVGKEAAGKGLVPTC